ncbi:MAG: hypothetical protein GX572_05990 [Clostridia bacterium]|nr:hypothetical protein [Clostridia bacterium]
MKNESQIIALSDLYKRQLLLAIEEKTGSPIADPTLDLLILSLIDRLETLDWVLGQNSDESTGCVFGNSLSH